ncbi:hypothetical protein [Chryseobacterium sp. JV558]|uniref:hypothetical protein n=1 Tax=Chryseobacterium sp. JV558 TaxID=2663236 RepID=UPI00299E734F|nr:hypothetical protein [Chryseobacterium sp. JV558]MDW9379162.1 hypothetical protein [Chryseobacterium sp. JV558]
MKYLLISILTIINVKSQLLLNIKSADAGNNSKLIVLEIFNPSNLIYSLPIDTISFRPFSNKNNDINSFRPLIEIKHKNKSINYKSSMLELDETQIDRVNNGNKLIYTKSKNEILKIKPKEKLSIPIKFNPFQFNIENGKYNNFEIINNQDYIITIYLATFKFNSTDNDKERIISSNDFIKSNSIKTKWNYKKTKYVVW